MRGLGRDLELTIVRLADANDELAVAAAIKDLGVWPTMVRPVDAQTCCRRCTAFPGAVDAKAIRLRENETGVTMHLILGI